MSWREITLGSAIHVKHGYAFKGEFFSDSGKYIVLTPGNFNEEGGFRIRPEKDRAYIGDIPEAFVLDEGDLIIAMTEQGPGLLGSSALIPQADRYLHNQRLGLVDQVDTTLLNKRFLYFLFNTSSVRAQISGSASGTKVRHTAPERIYQVRVRVPDVKTQDKIVLILSNYDDLIENNRRRMALLEESARMLYQEWFVRLRFPGHEHTRIVDGVPEGWRRKTLAELADITMGQSPESQYYNDVGEGLPFHQGVADFGDRFVNHRIHCTVPNRIAKPGDILCSVRAPVGRLNITLDKIVIGRGLSALRSKTSNQSFLFHQLRNHFFKEDLIGAGAIFAAVTKKEFEAQIFLAPLSRLVQQFEEVSNPIDEQLRILHLQNQKLRTARDLLLPRLMSGEIAV
jgi:type I restriction enzyme S subunit